MTNYSADEEERKRDRENQRKRKKFMTNYHSDSVKIGESTKHSYNVIIDDEQFLQLAKKAAKNDVTFNQMVNLTLIKNLKDNECIHCDDDYQYENPPQLLNEG